MSRFFALLALFLILFAMQNGFFASLPGALPLFPLLLTAGVYLLQHQSLSAGAWLIAANGLYLDWLHLQAVPLESVSYIVTALAAAYLATHVFSNRSLYGVIACGLAALAVLKLSQFAILGLIWIRETESVVWPIFYQETAWSALLLLVGLIVMFPFASRIKKFLQKIFLSAGPQTL